MEYRLAEYVKTHNEQETPAHSLIVDTDDPDIEKLFSRDEWESLMELLPKSSDSHPMLKQYLDLFYNVSYLYLHGRLF